MPSRAVIRKKARRETKLRNRANDKALAIAIANKVSDVDDKGQVSSTAASKSEVEESRRRLLPDTAVKENAEALSGTEGMSRKERKRMKAKQRLKRQLERLNAARVRKTAVAVRDEQGESDEKGEDAKTSPATSGTVLRHDPKFTNGTFWRTRKERRRRTVFLGNMPIRYTVENVTNFVTTTVRASILTEGVDPAEEIVDSVDLLKPTPKAKWAHMYVTLQSVELAGQAIKALDGLKLEGAALRCNFAADKEQRKMAIQRRSGGGGGGGSCCRSPGARAPFTLRRRNGGD
uniref:Putative RNA binding protein n=1 Tax=Trypanosoma vivax (strain Y486) TaxID=1055687 RepID=G0UBV4_TRYVY|nr:putative RNA binding protein [Trypanosoma vivax Y486]